MGDLVPFNDGLNRIVERQLAELNRQAGITLDRPHHPAPDGLPPDGSWIRVVRPDDDGRSLPMTPWHYVVGWDPMLGVLSVRCRRRPGEAVRVAVRKHIGEDSDWPYPFRRLPWMLLIESERPGEDACRQCSLSLERDAAAVVRREAEEREAHIVAVAWKYAADDSVSDAELGRRIRAIWPVAGK